MRAAALHLLGVLFVALVLALAAGRFVQATDPPAPADAIVVLGGGRPYRARHAVTLYQAGHAPLVLFSGSTFKDVGLACSEALLALEAAQELGLPGDAVLIVEGATSTYEEAVNLRPLVRERGWRALIVVTDGYHTRRAGRTFRALLPDTAIYVSAAPNPEYDLSRWWQTERGLIAVVNELIKLAYYWLKHGIAPL